MSLIGIDYGGRRIGVAVSESGVLASPHSVIANEGDIIAEIDRLGRELGADTYVVGLPRRTHSTDGEAKFRRFAEELRQKTCKPVVLWDETLTSIEAEERLRESGHKGRGKKELDMYAAAVILQSYLDHQSGRTS
ncbi:MAG TPA: Holliday junction resolvase RuvX [Thermoanaerobaculia bacterium]|nr:Holliday junction resolvase RuvX [Thermoanaerobaculia bacterium]